MNIYHPFTLSPEEREEIAREEAQEALLADLEDEFHHWQRFDERNREDADFREWLAERAQPHMRGHERYREAMTVSERLSDEALRHIASGAKAYQQSKGWRG